MGLKKKLLKATKGIVNNIDKISADTVINSTINALGKAAGMKTTQDFTKDKKKKYLYVKIESFSVNSIAKALNGKDVKTHDDVYQVYDNNGILKYTSTCDTDLLMDKDKVIIYNSQKEKLGYVRENYISVGVPFLEKDVKKCEIFLGKECVAKLKSYKEFKTKRYDTLEGKLHITYSDDKTFEYKLKRGNKIISVVNELPIKFVDGYTDRYVLEYRGTESNDEILAVLLMVALDKIKQ